MVGEKMPKLIITDMIKGRSKGEKKGPTRNMYVTNLGDMNADEVGAIVGVFGNTIHQRTRAHGPTSPEVTAPPNARNGCGNGGKNGSKKGEWGLLGDTTRNAHLLLGSPGSWESGL